MDGNCMMNEELVDQLFHCYFANVVFFGPFKGNCYALAAAAFAKLLHSPSGPCSYFVKHTKIKIYVDLIFTLMSQFK